MRGVSTIIAIILILMIVVALAALTWTWFNSVISILFASAEGSIEDTSTTMGTDFIIENAKFFDLPSDHVNATIRNRGSQNFNISKSSVYIDGEYSDIGGFEPPNILTPGDRSIIYNIINTTPACGAVLKIVIETGLSKTLTISC